MSDFKFHGSNNSTTVNVDDCVLCLIDHQTGLFNTVRDMEEPDLRRNVVALARAGRLSGIPVFTTSSVETGPNGPLIPELAVEVPNAVHIPRHGEINAWDMPQWVKEMDETGRKTLIIAGTLTEVCLTFPALSAVKNGYTVYAVVDASGASSRHAYELAVARMQAAGVIVTSTFAMICELMGTHARPDVLEWYGVMCLIIPRYQLLIESYQKAQKVASSASSSK